MARKKMNARIPIEAYIEYNGVEALEITFGGER